MSNAHEDRLYFSSQIFDCQSVSVKQGLVNIQIR